MRGQAESDENWVVGVQIPFVLPLFARRMLGGVRTSLPGTAAVLPAAANDLLSRNTSEEVFFRKTQFFLAHQAVRRVSRNARAGGRVTPIPNQACKHANTGRPELEWQDNVMLLDLS